MSGINYNANVPFATKETTDEYINSAIAKNIQHSLKCYQSGGHFRHLYDLYEKDELTSTINRVVENINHRFTLEVLARDFKSNDLAISASNLRRDKDAPTDILDRVDIVGITKQLKELLEIRDPFEQTVTLTDAHKEEIKEYLDLLDLTVDIDVINMTDYNDVRKKTAVAQPGIRYSQADALISQLMLDETFRELSLSDRKAVIERIRNEIKGRMMEDIVLLETRNAKQDCKVFTLQFAIGEFDMVVFDEAAGCCSIYEVKHSKETVPNQYRHLVDEQKCRATEFRYGTIKEKCVIYRGKTTTVDGIRYLNVEEYLNDLIVE